MRACLLQSVQRLQEHQDEANTQVRLLNAERLLMVQENWGGEWCDNVYRDVCTLWIPPATWAQRLTPTALAQAGTVKQLTPGMCCIACSVMGATSFARPVLLGATVTSTGTGRGPSLGQALCGMHP